MAKTSKDQMEESPLMSKSTPQSTISPEKMEKSRFTEMKDLEEDKANPMRIVIYAIIVIVIGVGLAFLVRTLINNNNQGSTDTEETTDTEEDVEETSAFEISLSPKNDTAASNLAANEDYTDSEIATLGDSTIDMTAVGLDTISYDRYETFARTIFVFSGNSGKLPKTNVTYSATEDELRVEFEGLTSINGELLVTEEISDIVDSISYDTQASEFVIVFSEDSKYRVFNSGGNLAIDVKTLEEINKPEEVVPPTTDDEEEETSTTPPTSNGTKPAAPHYTNSFSQSQQYVSSSVTANNIGFNNFWIWDEGTFFEFSLGMTSAVGEQYIPNATAYYEEEDGTTYLMLEVENLSNAPFSQTMSRTLQDLVSASGASINPDTVNFVKVDLESFSGGKATYKIEVKNKANFQLLSQTTYDNTSQILSIQIKD